MSFSAQTEVLQRLHSRPLGIPRECQHSVISEYTANVARNTKCSLLPCVCLLGLQHWARFASVAWKKGGEKKNKPTKSEADRHRWKKTKLQQTVLGINKSSLNV